MKKEIRNIAIIAHVDHGKTTLVNQLLVHAGTFRKNQQIQDRMMDSDDIERERGITILAKNTAIELGDRRVNILDTPGHADFGGEVERILKMVDGVLLVVDSFEGCMPQTRFVLSKALEQDLVPIVVINKIDRPNARPQEVVDEVLDLFIELGANDEQLEFPIVYASALQGTSSLIPEEQQPGMEAVFQTIFEHIPAPHVDEEGPSQMQITMLDYDDYLGRIGIGRIERGKLRRNQSAVLLKRDGSKESVRIQKLYSFLGLKRIEVEEAMAGDIVAVAGIGDMMVGETIADPACPEALPLLKIDEPTLKMAFIVNNSPFAGQDGKYITSRKIRERLFTEMERDVSLRVEETDSPDSFIVSGRGELHLSILIEKMRRGGYEVQVSKPEVIIREIDGKKMEPVEEVIIDVPNEYLGAVLESVGPRKAEMQNMVHQENGTVRLEFLIPSRGLIGYRSEFVTLTHGYGILNHSFATYKPIITEEVGGRRNGVLIASDTGTATPYGLLSLEDRGIMFINPGTEVYEGMIVGEHNRDQDLTVNVCRMKHLTNVRSATKETTEMLKAPHILTLEEALEYLGDDEYCEITPNYLRLRKKYLTKSDRVKAKNK
ncbi:translational GTPase TypA [Rubeoparvulum massiliense]|uniref:translational GTPase TypA n=1 Tax=Rubeoparvulum massiliense TaxID=1631346 RepID=UPI00065E5361|nr:translational GTPase TypA [Rubeoparvulum massiliense]